MKGLKRSLHLIPSHPVWVDSTGRPVFVSSSSWDLQALKTCWKEGKIGRDAVWIFWGLPLRFGRTVSDSFLIPAGSRISWLTFFSKARKKKKKKSWLFQQNPFLQAFSFFLLVLLLSFFWVISDVVYRCSVKQDAILCWNGKSPNNLGHIYRFV